MRAVNLFAFRCVFSSLLLIISAGVVCLLSMCPEPSPSGSPDSEPRKLDRIFCHCGRRHGRDRLHRFHEEFSLSNDRRSLLIGKAGLTLQTLRRRLQACIIVSDYGKRSAKRRENECKVLISGTSEQHVYATANSLCEFLTNSLRAMAKWSPLEWRSYCSLPFPSTQSSKPRVSVWKLVRGRLVPSSHQAILGMRLSSS